MAVAVLATGWALLEWINGQAADKVRVWEPGYRSYNHEEDVAQRARCLSEYALLCAVVNEREWTRLKSEISPSKDLGIGVKQDPSNATSASEKDIPGWTQWGNFPSESFKDQAIEEGLYLEVWDHKETGRVAVVFKGTDFESWIDWLANFHWFTRYFPCNLSEDQYTMISGQFGLEFIERLKTEMQANLPANIKEVVAVGHSLGGGLAQHFAYSYPLAPDQPIPRVKRVYAFNPSPVTGWYSVEEDLATENAKGLKILRVFEHGEALAYLRLLMRFLHSVSEENPAITHVRYDLDNTYDFFLNHAIGWFARALRDHALSDTGDGLPNCFI